MNNKKTINYYPALRESVGSINAAILVAYLEECFKEKGQGFYKFMEPCGHRDYKIGESWVEELHMTGTEFRTAFKHIGVVYKSKREYNLSRDKFQGKMYLSYYDRISKLTYYMRNDELVERRMKEVQSQESINQEIEHQVNVEQGNMQSITDETLIGIIDYNNKTNIKTNNKTNNKTNIETKSYTDQDINVDIECNTIMHNTSECSTGICNASMCDTTMSSTNTSDVNMDSTNIYHTNMDGTRVCKTNMPNSVSEEVKGCKPNESEAIEVPFEAIRKLFNQICASHNQILEWSQGQKQKLSQLWTQYGEGMEAFKAAFEKIEASDFLSGRINAWKAQLNWIFKPEHFADILRGKYRNFEVVESKKYQRYNSMLSHEWDFDEIERLEQERIDRILTDRGYASLCY